MKKTTSFLLSLFIFLSAIPLTHAESTTFTDIPEIHLYKSAINYAYENDIVNGYPDRTYKPDNSINRAEFTKIIINAKFNENEINNCETDKTFSDVNENEWYYPYLCTAVNEGIIDGYPDGSFKPGNNINFAEAAKIIVNTFGYEINPLNLWYQPFVEALENISAIPQTVYSFEKSVTRGEMVEMVYRLKENIQDKTSTELFLGDSRLIKSTTFIKQYRIRDRAYAKDVYQTSDGGYILTGETLLGRSTDGFFTKVNANGDHEWTKLFLALGTDKAEAELGRAVTELKNGDYVMAGVLGGFVTDEYQAHYETWGDIALIKLDTDGNHLWTRIVGDYGADEPYQLHTDDDGGFFLSGFVSDTGYGFDPAGEIPGNFILVKFDSEGQIEWQKKMSTAGAAWDSKSEFKIDPSGGFIVITEVPILKSSELWESSISSSMPTIIKLDDDFEVEWTKSIEAIPMEFYSAIEVTEDGYETGYMEMRMPAGTFTSIQITPDGGYLAIGILSPFTMGEIESDSEYEFVYSPTLTGVKVDKDGNFEWAKTIKTDFLTNDRTELSTAKTKDNGFAIIRNVMAGSDEYYEKYDIMMEKKEEAYILCGDCGPEEMENDPILKEAFEEHDKAFADLLDSARNNIELIKTDEDFNVQWVKKIGEKTEDFNIKWINETTGTKAMYFGTIQATSDYGMVISGQYLTDILNFIFFGEKFYFDDALLIKLDVDGNVVDDSKNLISEDYSVSRGDLTSYITMYDFPPIIEDFEFTIDITESGQKPSHSTETTELYASAEETVTTFESGPLFNISDIPISEETTSWAEISYEQAETVETENEKSREIHEELLIILNELFNNEVKLRDNFGGISLDYIFKRLVTEEDVEAVQVYLEELGYETRSDENGQLIMNKIGRTLTLLFSITNKMKGTLNVTY